MRTILTIGLIVLMMSCGTKFDSNEWKKHSSLDEIENPRWGMVDDLVKMLEKEKPNEKRVRELLGEGEYEHTYAGNKFIYYPIGWQSGFGIDPDYFVIEIDSVGQFKNWRQEQH